MNTVASLSSQDTDFAMRFFLVKPGCEEVIEREVEDVRVRGEKGVCKAEGEERIQIVGVHVEIR